MLVAAKPSLHHQPNMGRLDICQTLIHLMLNYGVTSSQSHIAIVSVFLIV